MSKVIIQNKHGNIIITNKLSYPEAVNERVINAIASGVFESFVPVSVKQSHKEVCIECCVQGFITLNQYFSGLVSKKAFLDFVYALVLIIKNCEKDMISADNLYLHKDCILIDPVTKAVRCIYWPVVNNRNSNPPQFFFRQLPYELQFNPYEDCTYVDRYVAFFNGFNPFSINDFERMLLEMQGKKAPAFSRSPADPFGNASANNHSAANVKSTDVKMENVAYDPFSNVSNANDAAPAAGSASSVCAACGAPHNPGAKFCANCGSKITDEAAPQTQSPTPAPAPAPEPAPAPASAPVPVSFEGTAVSEIGETVVLGYNEPEKVLYPSITRCRTGEKFSIDKPVFRIGKERAYCDLFIKDNNYISRSHADIITRDKRYFVVDRNSTNKTYVDGRVIAKETEMEIFDGTVIKLANEEFIFSLK